MEKKTMERQQHAIEVMIKNILDNGVLDIKKIPDSVLDMMEHTANGPSHVLSTVSVYYYLNHHGKNAGTPSSVTLPYQKMQKITRDIGFLCQVERMRRRSLLDYEIDMHKIFDAGTAIKITRGSAFPTGATPKIFS